MPSPSKVLIVFEAPDGAQDILEMPLRAANIRLEYERSNDLYDYGRPVIRQNPLDHVELTLWLPFGGIMRRTIKAPGELPRLPENGGTQ